MAATINALPYFTPDASIGAWFGATSSNFLLPGTPASDSTVLITNLGQYPVIFKLGTSNAVVAALPSSVGGVSGFVVMPGDQLAVGIGSNTYIAGITSGALTGGGSPVNLTTGN